MKTRTACHFSWIIILLLTVLSGCSALNGEQVCESTFHSGDSFTNQCALEVSEGQNEAELYFDASLTEGHLLVTLTNPNGAEQWQSDASSERESNQHIALLDPIPGKWVLTIQVENGKGEYRGEWNAR